MSSPTHHKSPTVAGPHPPGLEREHKAPHLPPRPHSTYIQGYNIIPESTGVPSEQLDSKTADSVRLSPLTSKIPPDVPMDSSAPTVTQPVQPDGGAPPSLASAPDTKPPRELKDPKHKETLSTSAISTSAVVEKDVVKGRKGSEPPPSLQALFTRDMGSSRRWANRPFSTADTDIGNIHLKQHSFDSSHLQSLSPQSPKLYMRRVKSPSVSDKNTRGGVEMTLEGLAEGRRDSEGSSGGGGGKDIGLHRTPSHPHLNSATSSPQVSRHASAHSTDPTSTASHSTCSLQPAVEIGGGQ